MSARDPMPTWPALGVAVRAIVVREDGRILILRRAAHTSSDPGAWELPGGKMDHGETVQEALAREVMEESGLAVRVGKPIHVTHFTKEPFWVTCVTFVCDLLVGEVRLSDENDDHAWIHPSKTGGRRYARTIEEQISAYAEYRRRTP